MRSRNFKSDVILAVSAVAVAAFAAPALALDMKSGTYTAPFADGMCGKLKVRGNKVSYRAGLCRNGTGRMFEVQYTNNSVRVTGNTMIIELATFSNIVVEGNCLKGHFLYPGYVNERKHFCR